jgi:hypothetical protein
MVMKEACGLRRKRDLGARICLGACRINRVLIVCRLRAIDDKTNRSVVVELEPKRVRCGGEMKAAARIITRI